ncbi:MAG: hypothetical protein Q9216_003069 [Gyalolechia sp. 2 TL-2023]
MAYILGGVGTYPGDIESFKELFYDTSFVEDARLTNLHKIILQLQYGNISEELQKSTAKLDNADSMERTSLSWAAQRGQVETVRLFLEHGADPNSKTSTNGTILHYAAQANTPDCLLLLIKAGARITQNSRGYTALHYAATGHDDLTYIKPLLDHGAGIDTRTYVGKTALSLAIVHNHTKTAAFLIQRGANPKVLDNEGQSPLALAIKFRHIESLQLLMQSGAKHALQSEGSDTLLHLVAGFPDLGIIEYLSTCDLSGEDVDARNGDQLTARELLQAQKSDPKVAVAFQKLLDKVGAERKPVAEILSKLGVHDDSDSDSSEDIFEDCG